MVKNIFFFGIFIVLFSDLKSQDIHVLKVGERMPKLPVFAVANSSYRKINLDTLNDKLVIYDYWATFCSGCVAQFPHLDSLQRIFKDKIQVMLFAEQNRNAVEDFFSRVNKRYHFILPSIIEDTVLDKCFMEKKQWLANYFWVKNGVVVAYTNAKGLNENNIRLVLSGKPLPEEQLAPPIFERVLDHSQPLSWPANPVNSTDVLNHSILTRYLKAYDGDINFGKTDSGRSITIVNCPIAAFYLEAYQVRSFKMLFEVSNEKHINPRGVEQDSTNLFCYQLSVPYTDTARFHKAMQEDLDRIFCFKTSLQLRKRKVYVLYLASGFQKKNLVSKGGEPDEDGNRYYLTLKNQPFTGLVDELKNIVYGKHFADLIDETGIDYPIDISLDADMHNGDQVREELKKYGLDLRTEEREVGMIVVSDHN